MRRFFRFLVGSSQPPRIRAVVAAVAFMVCVPPVAKAVDPFYQNLLRKGQQALVTQNPAEAARLLQLACFGMLDTPPVLAECLVFLGLAEAQNGDEEAFRRTFLRIAEVEQRFQGYSQAALAPEVRSRFERSVKTLIPATTLRAYPTFEKLLPSLEEQMAGLKPGQQRRLLQQVLSREKNNDEARLLLARLELQEKKPKLAVALASEILKNDPKNAQALLLRGQSFAALKDWEKAATDLTLCACANTDPQAAEALAESLGNLNRLQELESLLTTLPEAWRKRSAIAQWQNKLSSTAPPRATLSPPDNSLQGGSGLPVPSPTPPRAEEEESINQVRLLLSQGQLAKAAQRAEDLVRERPDDVARRLLAAEAAYRQGRFAAAVEHYRKAGEVKDPSHQFYFAVSLYEIGERDASAAWLRKCLPNIKKSEFVQSYATKILGAP